MISDFGIVESKPQRYLKNAANYPVFSEQTRGGHYKLARLRHHDPGKSSSPGSQQPGLGLSWLEHPWRIARLTQAPWRKLASRLMMCSNYTLHRQEWEN